MPRSATDLNTRFRLGFTLIELSIGLTILSLLAAGALTVGGVMVEQQQFTGSNARVTEAKQALADYFKVNGRLPCPASLTLAPGAAGFGTEDANNNAVADCSVGGAAPAGTFRVNAAGAVAVAGANVAGVVRVGALPVRTLGLRDSAMGDEYGNRILYAMTEQFSDTTLVAGASGAMTLQDGSGNNIATTATSNGVVFTVLSHGPDGKGAYRYQTGVLALACGASTNLDVQNCDYNTGAAPRIIFRDTRFNNGSVADSFFDDMVGWMPKYLLLNDASSALSVGNDKEVIYNNSGVLDGAGQFFWDAATNRVGIGSSTPVVPLEVNGPANSGSTLQLAIRSTTNTVGSTAGIGTQTGTGVATNNNFMGSIYSEITQVSPLQTDVTIRNNFGNNSTPVITFKANSNVGIGTVGPIHKLEVESTGSAIGVRNTSAQAGHFGQLFSEAPATFVVNSGGTAGVVDELQLRLENVTGLRMGSVGGFINVGIGAAPSTARLAVSGTNVGSYIATFENAGATGSHGALGTGNTYGLVGYSRGAGTTYGVLGQHLTSTSYGYLGGTNYGVLGSGTAYGVYGVPLAGNPGGTGVLGASLDTFHQGSLGHANSFGVYAYTAPGAPGGSKHSVYAANLANGAPANSNSAVLGVADGALSVGGNFRVSNAGSSGVLAYNTSSTYYCYIATGTFSLDCNGPNNLVSDGRLKKDITPLSGKEGLQAIMALKPVHYLWKDERKNATGLNYGFIAQDVEKVFPTLVGESEVPQVLDKNGKSVAGSKQIKNKNMNYNGLISPLVKSVQELKHEQDALKEENAALKARIDTIEAVLKDKGVALPETSAPATDGPDYRTLTLLLGGALAGFVLTSLARRKP